MSISTAAFGVKKASRDLYLLDGQISLDRAVLYADARRLLELHAA
jgi:hypothetical protein